MAGNGESQQRRQNFSDLTRDGSLITFSSVYEICTIVMRVLKETYPAVVKYGQRLKTLDDHM